MQDNLPGRDNRRWPLGFDPSDAEGIADFCLGMGYEFTPVVNAVRRRCNLDLLTARSIVASVAQRKGIAVQPEEASQ